MLKYAINYSLNLKGKSRYPPFRGIIAAEPRITLRSGGLSTKQNSDNYIFSNISWVFYLTKHKRIEDQRVLHFIRMVRIVMLQIKDTCASEIQD